VPAALQPTTAPPAALSIAPPAERPDPATLHPLVWRAHQLGRQAVAAQPSGWATLDAQLPGGGWPHRALTELLLPHPGVGEVRLLAHALASVQRAGRLVMLFDPPAQLCAWALAALGIEPEQLLVIHTRAEVLAMGAGGSLAEAARRASAAAQGARGGAGSSAGAGASAGGTGAGGGDSLWALEQALKSGHVGAVLAWLPPRLRIERLRRLQLAAAAHHGPAFVLREPAAAQQPTPAPLRLLLAPGGGDQLSLQLLKRRGPPLEQPLHLRLPGVLGLAAARRAQAARLVPSGGPALSPGAAAGRPAHNAATHAPPMAPLLPGEQAQAEACALALTAGRSGGAPLRAAAFINLGS
jgi:protein ImuA